MNNEHSAVVSVRSMMWMPPSLFTPTISVSFLMWILLPHLLRLLVAICGCCSVVKKTLVGKRCLMDPNRRRGVGNGWNQRAVRRCSIESL